MWYLLTTSFEHFKRLLVTCFFDNMFCWYTSDPATLGIISPFFRHVEATIYQCKFTSTGVCKEGSNLTVFYFAESSTPLTLDTDTLCTFLGKRGRIKNKDTILCSDVSGNLSGKYIKNSIIIPIDLSEKHLERLTIRTMKVGNGFNVFSLGVGEQTFEIGKCFRLL